MKELHLFDDPQYAAGRDNLVALNRRRDEIQREIAKHSAAKRPAAGAHLVVGLESPPADTVVDVQALTSELRQVESAIRLQGEVLDGMKQEVARQLCKQLVPDYRQRLTAFVDALQAVGKAADALRGFIHFYEGQCGLPLVLPQVGFDPGEYSAANVQARNSLLAVRVKAALLTLDHDNPPTEPATVTPTKARRTVAAR